MSVYQFLSSNMPLEKVKNTQIEFLSIEEAEDRNIPLPTWYSKDMNINRTKKILLFAPNEDSLSEIQIIDDSDSLYAKQYSNKSYHSALEWQYSDKRAQQLIEYIGEHLTYSSEIELWNIWLDRKSRPTVKKCFVNSLDIADIKEIVEQYPYEKPCCLVVYK